MTIYKKTNDIEFYLRQFVGQNKTTGFIPTMGALHKGHISLIEKSKQQDQLTICSIFINPAQFNDPDDYKKYPVTISQDILLLEQAGCDMLFFPAVEEIYPDGPGQDHHYDLGYLETVLEGQFRPGHFQAVCMVIDKLLRIIGPDRLYLGQKDYQQCMVIKKLLLQIKLDKPIAVEICNTMREDDGLAMSSRNMRLSKDERIKALGIYNSLNLIKSRMQQVSVETIKKEADQLLIANGLRPDYIEIANAENLEILPEWQEQTKMIALIAAFMNEVRLIDNMPLN